MHNNSLSYSVLSSFTYSETSPGWLVCSLLSLFLHQGCTFPPPPAPAPPSPNLVFLVFKLFSAVLACLFSGWIVESFLWSSKNLPLGFWWKLHSTYKLIGKNLAPLQRSVFPARNTHMAVPPHFQTSSCMSRWSFIVFFTQIWQISY